MEGLILKMKRLHSDAITPTYATSGSACFDLYSTESVTLSPSFPRGVVGTGWAFEIPEGWCLKIYSRSGHGFNHNVRLSNCVGVIDSDYRGEVKVKLICDTGSALVMFKKGERVAQAMLERVEQVGFEEVGELGESVRGIGGFGSSGV